MRYKLVFKKNNQVLDYATINFNTPVNTNNDLFNPLKLPSNHVSLNNYNQYVPNEKAYMWFNSIETAYLAEQLSSLTLGTLKKASKSYLHKYYNIEGIHQTKNEYNEVPTLTMEIVDTAFPVYKKLNDTDAHVLLDEDNTVEKVLLSKTLDLTQFPYFSEGYLFKFKNKEHNFSNGNYITKGYRNEIYKSFRVKKIKNKYFNNFSIKRVNLWN